MSGIVGEVPVFYPHLTDWQVYTVRLEQFFEINDIAPEKKKALLITSVNEDIYKTLRDVCHPVLPKNKTYDELIELLNKQFVARTSVFRERVKFYNDRQYPSESIAGWLAHIKKLSIDCKFGDQLENILVDRFISGLKPSTVLDRLCEEEGTLTLQKAVEIATHKESSAEATADDEDQDNFSNNYNNRRYNNNNYRGRRKNQHNKTIQNSED